MTSPTGIPSISVTDAEARLRTESDPRPLLVDVREPGEFEGVRAGGAALVPMSTFVTAHGELPKDRPLLVVCAAGGRSAAATAFLLRSGWSDVSNVDGGMTAWERAGLPVRRGPIAAGEGVLPEG
jgi:rhodanese-related sulfurtransferase